MPALNIYVPDDLKARMDPIEANWSEIVRPSILAVVADHEHKKEQTMTTTLERLRASKAKHEINAALQGEAAGRKWAADLAEYPHLVRVARLDPKASFDDLETAIDPTDATGGLLDLDELIGGGLSDPIFMRAFIAGARTFYQEVEAQLQA